MSSNPENRRVDIPVALFSNRKTREKLLFKSTLASDGLTAVQVTRDSENTFVKSDMELRSSLL